MTKQLELFEYHVTSKNAEKKISRKKTADLEFATEAIHAERRKFVCNRTGNIVAVLKRRKANNFV